MTTGIDWELFTRNISFWENAIINDNVLINHLEKMRVEVNEDLDKNKSLELFKNQDWDVFAAMKIALK